MSFSYTFVVSKGKDERKELMAHWTRNLPLAGKYLLYMSESQEKKLREIADLQHKIRMIERDYKEEEAVILENVKRNWDEDEIAAAKQETETIAL
jgi:Ribonuclease G/E